MHGSFFILLAYIGYVGWQEAHWMGFVWGSLTLIAFFACVVLHELGHSFTAMRYGIGVRRILLMPIGGMAEMDSIPREPRRELLITLAGPAVNFVLAAVLWYGVVLLPDSIALYSWQGLLYRLFWANIVMGVFNLIPAFPMDGGRIFRAILATRLSYLAATRWATQIGKVLAVLGIVVMILWLDSWLGALLFAFIIMAGETEFRAVQRREKEDAHWREMIRRHYAMRGREPPVINPDKS